MLVRTPRRFPPSIAETARDRVQPYPIRDTTHHFARNIRRRKTDGHRRTAEQWHGSPTMESPFHSLPARSARITLLPSRLPFRPPGLLPFEFRRCPIAERCRVCPRVGHE